MNYFALPFLLAIVIHQACLRVQVEAGDGFVRTRGIYMMLNGSLDYAYGFNAYCLMTQLLLMHTKIQLHSESFKPRPYRCKNLRFH